MVRRSHTIGPTCHLVAPVKLDLCGGFVTHHELRHSALAEHSPLLPSRIFRTVLGAHPLRVRKLGPQGAVRQFRMVHGDGHLPKGIHQPSCELIIKPIDDADHSPGTSRASHHFVAQSTHSIATSSPKQRTAREIKNGIHRSSLQPPTEPWP